MLLFSVLSDMCCFGCGCRSSFVIDCLSLVDIDFVFFHLGHTQEIESSFLAGSTGMPISKCSSVTRNAEKTRVLEISEGTQ